MKTKEEAIKEAWGVVWFLFNKQEKETLVKNNGYYKGSNDDIFEAIDQNEHLFDFIAEKGSIPYSLEGIDDNNGWISINSKLDIPKETSEYLVVTKNGHIRILYLHDYEDLDFWIDNVTHYQPITKPKLPLHR